MRLFAIRDWRFHLELDLNLWLLGVTWHIEPSDLRDVSVYFGPVNLQIEKYDRGVCSDPKLSSDQSESPR
ncbi:hypothetical protein CWB41_12165 [Methylovirgula ligni]|uniref:Uncharacterized protein n=1 Tax=Methylovirgula ligni TaxID=569860 RepID=A0A3D9YTP8_9HYPH|nr:hypothetical protein CWB41_12165 [Methylovirgula ligni]REF85885.1 hypothetical protein DES32_1923 [Methylovirgula ligni]